MNSTQEDIIRQLRMELGNSETTEHLIDWLLDAWQTLDMLRDCFEEARALHIFTAAAPQRPASARIVLAGHERR